MRRVSCLASLALGNILHGRHGNALEILPRAHRLAEPSIAIRDRPLPPEALRAVVPVKNTNLGRLETRRLVLSMPSLRRAPNDEAFVLRQRFRQWWYDEGLGHKLARQTRRESPLCPRKRQVISQQRNVAKGPLSDIGECLNGENFYSLKEGQAKILGFLLLPPAAGYATLRSLFGGAMGMLG